MDPESNLFDFFFLNKQRRQLLYIFTCCFTERLFRCCFGPLLLSEKALLALRRLQFMAPDSGRYTVHVENYKLCLNGPMQKLSKFLKSELFT